MSMGDVFVADRKGTFHEHVEQAAREVAAGIAGHCFYWMREALVDKEGRRVPWKQRRVLCPEYLLSLPQTVTGWQELVRAIGTAPVVDLKIGPWIRQKEVQWWLVARERRTTEHWCRAMEERYGQRGVELEE